MESTATPSPEQRYNHGQKNKIWKIRLFSIKIFRPDIFSGRIKINISPQFHAVAVSYQLSDETLYTALITYDKKYNIIDMLEIAFDEIAESWSRIESTDRKSVV